MQLLISIMMVQLTMMIVVTILQHAGWTHILKILKRYIRNMREYGILLQTALRITMSM